MLWEVCADGNVGVIKLLQAIHINVVVLLVGQADIVTGNTKYLLFSKNCKQMLKDMVRNVIQLISNLSDSFSRQCCKQQFYTFVFDF